MDVEERHETAGSETNYFITHGTVASMFACSHRRTLRELGNVCTHTGMGYRKTSSLGGPSFYSGQKACLNFAPKTVRQSAFASEADTISSKALGYANIIKKTIQTKQPVSVLIGCADVRETHGEPSPNKMFQTEAEENIFTSDSNTRGTK